MIYRTAHECNAKPLLMGIRDMHQFVKNQVQKALTFLIDFKKRAFNTFGYTQTKTPKRKQVKNLTFKSEKHLMFS